MIGYDAKRAAQNTTGLGNYSRFIIESICKAMPEERFLLYAPNPQKISALRGVDTIPNAVMRFPKSFFWKSFRSLWRVWGITSDLQTDGVTLFHGLSNELPLNLKKAKSIRSIVTIHDLIFLHHPECYKAIDRFIYNYKFRKACQIADRVIAVSECTKRDIIKFYGIPANKIDVVYQGCDEQFRKEIPLTERQAIRQKHRLPQRYALYVGSIERRKNLMLLAQALRLLPEWTSIVAIGKHTNYADEVQKYIDEQGLSNRFRMMSGIPFKDLPAIYQMADVFVYPSRYEGFGIPMLEALCSGVPAIGTTGSCLEEAGGPDSIYVDPDDSQALADAINRVLSDKELREDMIAKGKTYAKRFELNLLAKDLLKVYHKVLVSTRHQ